MATKPARNKKSVGRPSKFKDEYCQQAYKLSLLGATDKQISDFFEVNEDTIHEWKKTHLEFSESVRRGKMNADANVAEGLYRRAIGFEYDEVTFEKIDSKLALELTSTADIKTNQAYKKKVVTKVIVPDPGAAMNWLTNRQKELWRNKQSVELDFERLTDEQLDEIINRLLNNQNNDKKG